MKTISRIVHLPTLTVLLGVYLLSAAMIFTIPHRQDGFGRMNAYQAFAQTGKCLSLSLVDRTLVDWYMLGPTLESNIGPYTRIITRGILHLTPVFVVWFAAIAAMANRIKRKLRDRGFGDAK